MQQNLVNVNNQSWGIFYLKSFLLFFWIIWFLLAGTSNLFEYLNHFGFIPNISRWPFQADNYNSLKLVLNIYYTPTFILDFLFICNFSVQLISGILFGTGLYLFWFNKSNQWKFINSAFMLSIALWSTFNIMQEVFLAYKIMPQIEHVFMGFNTLEIVTLIMFHILPHRARN